MYEYRAVVQNIVDGDTVDLEVDLGFYMWSRLRFRLTGINAPERYTETGPASTSYLNQLLPVGSPCAIHTDKSDSFGRWIALIKLPWAEKTANELMVEAGHAELYTNRYAATISWDTTQ